MEIRNITMCTCVSDPSVSERYHYAFAYIHKKSNGLPYYIKTCCS